MWNHNERPGDFLIYVLSVSLFIVPSLLAQDDAGQEQQKQKELEQNVRQAYEAGEKLLKEKKVDKAYTKFQQAIEQADNLEPEIRGELLRWLWKSTSSKLFDAMLDDPQLHHAAERIMELSKGAYWTWRMDDARINRLVQNLTHENYKVSMESRRKLVSAGQYAAPRLIEELDVDSSERRSLAIMTLADMGSAALLPVVEALESGSARQRRNAAIVLGNIQDPRSIPALMNRFENDSDDIVRREAYKAINSILKGIRPDYTPKPGSIIDKELIKRQTKKKDAASSEGNKKNVFEVKQVPWHKHAWSEVKSDVVRKKKKGEYEDSEKVPYRPIKKTFSNVDAEPWGGAKAMGYKHIYVDEKGQKFLVHAHTKNQNGKTIRTTPYHKHYLKAVSSLPDNLEQYIHPWLTVGGKLFTARSFNDLGSAQQLYHQLAKLYYLNTPSVMNHVYGDSLVWEWNEEKKRPVARQVPEFLFPLELAAQTALDGLKMDASFKPLQPLLVNTYFSMFHEANLALNEGEKHVRLEILTENSFKKLQKDLSGRGQFRVASSIATVDVLYAALSRSITNEKELVAVSNLEALGTFADPEDLPDLETKSWKQKFARAYPLIEALQYENRRVRYHAASLLVDIEPQEKFLGWERVVPALQESIRTAGIRQVVVGSKDQEQINTLREVLRDPNLQTSAKIARDTNQFLQYAKNPPRPDLMLVDGDVLGNIQYSFDVPGQKEDVQHRLIDDLKNDVRTKAVPLVAIADSAEEKTDLQETFGDKVDVIIEGPVTVETITNVYSEHREKLLQGNMEMKTKEFAEQLAVMSAKALGSINPDATVFTNYGEAEKDLAGTLENRTDELRVLAAKALGRFGSSKSLEPLVNALTREEDAESVREAAGNAIARIYERSDKTPSDATLNMIAETVVNAPLEVQIAASRAIGAANIPDKKRLEVLQSVQKQRIPSQADSSS